MLWLCFVEGTMRGRRPGAAGMIWRLPFIDGLLDIVYLTAQLWREGIRTRYRSLCNSHQSTSAEVMPPGNILLQVV